MRKDLYALQLETKERRRRRLKQSNRHRSLNIRIPHQPSRRRELGEGNG